MEPRALGLFDLMHVFAPATKLLNWVRLYRSATDGYLGLHSQSWLKGSRWQFPPKKRLSLSKTGLVDVVPNVPPENGFPSLFFVILSIFTQFPNIANFSFSFVKLEIELDKVECVSHFRGSLDIL